MVFLFYRLPCCSNDSFFVTDRLSGSAPFKSKDEDSLYDLIKKGELDFSDEVWSSISSNGKPAVYPITLLIHQHLS